MFRWPVVRASWELGPSYGSPVSGASKPGRGRSRPRLFRRPAGPCYSGSRCFMGISLGLALVEGLPPPGWATSVNCAPSVERGGGENGWADGLTAGALRAGPEPPTKTSGEICWLEQCRPDAESSGPFSSGVGQRCRGGPQSDGEHALHQQGLPPGVDCVSLIRDEGS